LEKVQIHERPGLAPFAVSPDGERIAFGCDKEEMPSPRAWGQFREAIPVPYSPVLAFSATGTAILRAAGKGVDVYDVKSRKKITTLVQPDFPWDLAALNGTRFVIAGGLDADAAFHKPRQSFLAIWDWRTGLKVKALVGHKGLLRRVGATGDGSLIISLDNTGVAKIWNAVDGRCLQTLDTRASARFLGQPLMSVSRDGRRIAFSPRTGEYLTQWIAVYRRKAPASPGD